MIIKIVMMNVIMVLMTIMKTNTIAIMIVKVMMMLVMKILMRRRRMRMRMRMKVVLMVIIQDYKSPDVTSNIKTHHRLRSFCLKGHHDLKFSGRRKRNCSEI